MLLNLKREGSRILTTSRNRIEALRNIDSDIKIGDGMTIKSLTREADELDLAIHRYNNLLSDADAQRNYIRELERKMRDRNERIFHGIVAKFGRDSDEYEMVGGTRKSDISFGPKIKSRIDEDDVPDILT